MTGAPPLPWVLLYDAANGRDVTPLFIDWRWNRQAARPCQECGFVPAAHLPAERIVAAVASVAHTERREATEPCLDCRRIAGVTRSAPVVMNFGFTLDELQRQESFETQGATTQATESHAWTQLAMQWACRGKLRLGAPAASPGENSWGRQCARLGDLELLLEPLEALHAVTSASRWHGVARQAVMLMAPHGRVASKFRGALRCILLEAFKGVDLKSKQETTPPCAVSHPVEISATPLPKEKGQRRISDGEVRRPTIVARRRSSPSEIIRVMNEDDNDGDKNNDCEACIAEIVEPWKSQLRRLAVSPMAEPAARPTRLCCLTLAEGNGPPIERLLLVPHERPLGPGAPLLCSSPVAASLKSHAESLQTTAAKMVAVALQHKRTCIVRGCFPSLRFADVLMEGSPLTFVDPPGPSDPPKLVVTEELEDFVLPQWKRIFAVAESPAVSDEFPTTGALRWRRLQGKVEVRKLSAGGRTGPLLAHLTSDLFQVGADQLCVNPGDCVECCYGDGCQLQLPQNIQSPSLLTYAAAGSAIPCQVTAEITIKDMHNGKRAMMVRTRFDGAVAEITHFSSVINMPAQPSVFEVKNSSGGSVKLAGNVLKWEINDSLISKQKNRTLSPFVLNVILGPAVQNVALDYDDGDPLKLARCRIDASANVTVVRVAKSCIQRNRGMPLVPVSAPEEQPLVRDLDMPTHVTRFRLLRWAAW